ncbi:hypothetical protein DB43_EB00010, partial [Parachlamydia acanthamoebae]
MNIHLDNTQSSTYIAPVPKKKSPLSKITNFFINFLNGSSLHKTFQRRDDYT